MELKGSPPKLLNTTFDNSSSDQVDLKPGERVLLFVKRSSSRLSRGRSFRVVGHAQGKYRIGADNIAQKDGFTVLTRQDAKIIDNRLPLQDLIDIIRGIR